MPNLLRIVPLVTVLLPFVAAQSCQTTLGGNCGDSSRPRDKNCCTVGYCQPWNSGYYQCLDVPAKCPVQETDIDYYGNDLQTIYGIQPWDCCEKCSTTSGCAAYTFVNQNPDGKTACYLKTSVAGRVEKKGAVSAAYKDYVAPNCTTALWGQCGSAKGSSCCPNNAYCQPWNTGYYQCITTPSKCPTQETDIDYYGNDLQTIYGIQPGDCCEKCSATVGCAGYTFVNENPDGKTACYLKKSIAGRVAKKGAVSAAYTGPAPTCTAKVGDGCGNLKSGSTCCPSGSFCQPWNQYYYQCVANPPAAKCPQILVGVDFYGDDLRTEYNLVPDSCCDACYKDANCKAFTYVNENADGRSTCYLKKGQGTQQALAKAISGIKA